MYKLVNRNNELVAILRISDNASIPLDTDNTDYQAYLAWVAQGGVPTPADEVTK
jgi:hypothetical protein